MFPKNCPLFHHLRYMLLFAFSIGWWQSWKNEKESVLIPHYLPMHQVLWAASLLEVSLLKLPLLLSNYLNNPFCFSKFINHLFWGFILAANLVKFICSDQKILISCLLCKPSTLLALNLAKCLRQRKTISLDTVQDWITCHLHWCK